MEPSSGVLITGIICLTIVLLVGMLLALAAVIDKRDNKTGERNDKQKSTTDRPEYGQRKDED